MLQALHLNLSTRPFRNNTLPWIGLLVGIAVLGVATVWNITTFLDYRQQRATLDSKMDSYESEMADLSRRERNATQAIRQVKMKSLQVQAGKANDVIELKAFSWTRLFNMLEKTLPYEVRMTSIRPMFRLGNKRSQTRQNEEDGILIVVDGLAKTLPAFFEFEEALLEDVHFDRIEPEMHVKSQESQEQVFKIRFFYYPEGKPDKVVAATESEPVPESAVDQESEGGEEVDS